MEQVISDLVQALPQGLVWALAVACVGGMALREVLLS